MRRAASGTGFALAALLSALAMPGQVAATTDSLVISGGGREMFELIFYGKGDGPEPNFLSIRSPTAPEKQNMARGWSVWADVLGPTAKNPAALGVDVTMIDEVGNARCGSDISPLESGLTQLAEGIINGEPIEKRAFMDQGQSMSLGRPTVVPLHSDRGEIYSTAVHEAGHGLGLLTNMRKYKPGERTRFSAMDMHLVSYATGSAVWLRDLTDMEQVVRRDEHGKYFTYRQAVDEHGVHYLSWDVELPEGKPLPSGAFVIGDDSESDVFFQGPETMKTFSAYNAKTSGVRINGFEKMGSAMRPELSHLELAHSMMSHQDYRNYNFFMEVELAVLKDLGYQIDLKRFYGTSIYGDNLDPIDNTTPFYARSADGKSWLYGQPSEETFGIGLHVYGDGNTIVQKADILTRGEAATGMRIDGAGTNLTVPSGVQVRSDGTEGAGLLVAYGRNTKIAVQGTISAKGEGGMAVRFDFGGNCMGDLIEMRGSYIRKVLDNNKQLVDGALEGSDEAGFPLYLEGPLVDSFNLAGSLEGRDASIFMSDNAFVKEINILSGASVKGDIVSLWDAKNPLLHQKDAPKDSLYTALVFGRKAEADGGTSPDRGFNMILEGSVRGPKGIDMSLEAGSLRVNGEVHVHRLVNHGWLDVRGLGSQQTGTVSDTFTQGDDGVLQSQVTPDGRTTYISAHEGSARGRWAIEPARGYWGSGKAVVLADGPVVFDKGSTSFASALLVPSSSLALSFSLLDASGQPRGLCLQQPGHPRFRRGCRPGARSGKPGDAEPGLPVPHDRNRLHGFKARQGKALTGRSPSCPPMPSTSESPMPSDASTSSAGASLRACSRACPRERRRGAGKPARPVLPQATGQNPAAAGRHGAASSAWTRIWATGLPQALTLLCSPTASRRAGARTPTQAPRASSSACTEAAPLTPGTAPACPAGSASAST